MTGQKKIRVNPNPMIAYRQGYAEGEKTARAEDVYRGIKLVYAFLLLAMAYVNDRSDEDKKNYLSKPQFAEYYAKVAKTLKKFVDESIEGEDGIDTYDIADLYVKHDTEIRELYGLPKKKYDGTDEVV